MSEQDLLTHLRMRPYSNPSFWMLEAADEIERLRAEIERLRALLEGYEAMEKTMKRKVSG